MDFTKYFDLDQCQEDLRTLFLQEIAPFVAKQYGANDQCAMDEAFNDWLDSLSRDDRSGLGEFAADNAVMDDLTDSEWKTVLNAALKI